MNEQTIIFYSTSNALCSYDESVQIKPFEASRFHWYMFPFPLVQSANTDFLSMKAQRVLNRSSKRENVHYNKNHVFL